MLRRLIVFVTAICAAVTPLALSSPALAVGYSHDRVVSANPVDWTPNVMNGTVRAIAVVGNRAYVGGTFTTVRDPGSATNIPRAYLFAFDRSTHKVVAGFAPKLNGVVETIAPAPDGSSIIVGGRFTTLQGVAQRSIAMINATGARVPSFTAQTTGYVRKVLVRGNRLIAGGRFSKAHGGARSNLAAFNATTGALDPLNLPIVEGRTKADGTVTVASVFEMDATADGSRLVVIGNFRRVGGQQRMQIAQIDLTRNAVTSWFTNRYANHVSGTLQYRCKDVFDTQMRDVEFSPDGRYFVVVTTGAAIRKNVDDLCDTAARWETAPTGAAMQETWFNCTGGDSLYSVAVTNTAGTTSGAVYVGGHQRWLDNCGGSNFPVAGSWAQDGIGAINATTGKAIRTWPAQRFPRGVGAEELLANAQGLYVGGDHTQLSGENRQRFGLFPLT
jgi:hypothetical protein